MREEANKERAMTPRIGISTFVDPQPRASYCSLSEHYSRSVRLGGGLPFPIPQADDAGFAGRYVERIDGLLLSGGKDVDPALYGEEPIPGIGVFDAARDEWELALFKAAMARGIPILGICRGCQFVNAAMGGSLFQDLAAQRPGTKAHSPEGFPVDRLYHSANLVAGSLLRGIFGCERLRVNSFHHQAVKELAPGLEASAFAADGVLEGFESSDKTRFLVGVQFHPESLTQRFPQFVALFAAFVEACGGA